MGTVEKDYFLPILPKLKWTELDNLNFRNNINKAGQINLPKDSQEAINIFGDIIRNASFLGGRKECCLKYNFKEKWFDFQCLKLRKRVFSLLNLFKKTNSDLIKKYYIISNKEYRELCQSKKREFYLGVVNQFKTVKDSKGFWDLVNTLKNKKFIGSPDITGEEWFKYYCNLLNPPFQATTMLYAPPYNTNVKLDKGFELYELKEVLGRAKNGKAPGNDRIPYEFYKACPDSFLQILLNLFNTIYETSQVQSEQL